MKYIDTNKPIVSNRTRLCMIVAALVAYFAFSYLLTRLLDWLGMGLSFPEVVAMVALGTVPVVLIDLVILEHRVSRTEDKA